MVLRSANAPTWSLILVLYPGIPPTIWTDDPCADQYSIDTCVRAFTEAGWVRLTGDDVDECASRWITGDFNAQPFLPGNVSYTGFTSCMDDLRQRR